MHGVLALFIPILTVLSVAAVIIMAIIARNKERMLAIEKGADLSKITPKHRKSDTAIKLGLVAIGVGVGVVIASMLESGNIMGEEAYPAMIFLFAGMGLVAAHFLTKKEQDKQE